MWLWGILHNSLLLLNPNGWNAFILFFTLLIIAFSSQQLLLFLRLTQRGTKRNCPLQAIHCLCFVFFVFFLICIIAEICSSVWDQTLCFTFVHLLWLDSSFTTAGLWAMAQLESLAGPQKIDITTFISSLLVSAGRSYRFVLYLGDVAL